MAETSGEVTLLLAQWQRGNKDALTKLIPLVYAELRRIAAYYLRVERKGHTLQPTALVHEAYLRLVGQDRAEWRNRAQFLGLAAQMMRRILVDYARARVAGKRAGHPAKVDVAELGLASRRLNVEEILAVDQALGRLVRFDPQQGRVVELRYFAGLSIEETAEALGISPRTVKREWAMASAWLRGELA